MSTPYIILWALTFAGPAYIALRALGEEMSK